jgi:hypothetical protein
MICPACHGHGKRLNPALPVTRDDYTGTVRVSNPTRLPLLVLCEDCQGNGTAHCCDGMQEQADAGQG